MKEVSLSLIGGEKVKLFSITDIGRRREINEDYLYTSDKPVGNLPNLFIVADGMGGKQYCNKQYVQCIFYSKFHEAKIG